jgi:outer membrane protein
MPKLHMLCKRSRVLAAVACILCAGTFPIAAQVVLTLDDAVSIAVEHNRQLQQAALERDRATEAIAAARSGRWPQINVTALTGELLNHPTITFSRGSLGSLPGVGPVPANKVSLIAPERPIAIPFFQVNMPLTQQYRLGLGIRKAELEERFQREELTAAKADVIANVKNAYYKMLVDQIGLTAAYKTVELCKETERITNRYASEKTVLREELLDVQTRSARAEYEETVLRDSLVEQQEKLNSLLGRSIDIAFTVAPIDQIEGNEVDLVALEKKALAQNPELRKAALRVQEAEIDSRMKRSEYIPDISLSANYLSAAGLPAIFPQTFAVAGLLISWQPIDWGRKRHEDAALKRTAREAALTAQNEEDKVRVAIRTVTRKLREARQSLAVAQLDEERAREEARVKQIRYSQNATLLRSVLESQSAVSSAHQQTEKAITQWLEARTSLDRILGEE